ncbi:hypothetical protein PM082_005603 [Marasmius tenuissimus]|nr:hypothetical protein PM082_005603 [Marasmius tenuissimus]
MPKVVSRSAVSSSTDAQPTASSAAALRVYYCICGEFILVIDKSLSSLPHRKIDNASVIRSQSSDSGPARVFKLNTVAGDAVLIERENGHERQFRHLCPRCTLPVAYTSTPPPVKNAPFIYVLAGALTQMQGQMPKDALELENHS